ncbi:MAG: acyltransferase [Sphingobacteriaceae bacterium]|nr:acyltransferase [Sphingobacteriaceae bacterium]
MNKAKVHLSQVDYVRAIAAMAVALFHLGGKALPVLNLGWLGVEMFFLLSGFIICWAIPENYSIGQHGPKFIMKRLVRIEPPYIFSIALVIILNALFISGYTIDWANVLFHLAYLNNFTGHEYLNAVYWTLGIEFQFYILIAFFYPALRYKWGHWLLAVLCVVPVFFKLSPGILFNAFPIFGMGIYTFLLKKNRINKREFFAFVAITTMSTIFSLGIREALAALLALGIILSRLPSGRVVHFLANISFSLYLTHDIIGSNLVVYLGTVMPKTLFMKGLIFGSGIVISIAVAFIFYVLIEKPFLKLSKSISYQKGNTS